jgi:ribosomal protein L30
MYYRIHLYRSFIGLPETIRQTCRALGLRKRGAVVYREVNPQMVGQILKIKEIVKVNLVKDLATRDAELLSRKSSPGFTVEPRAL